MPKGSPKGKYFKYQCILMDSPFLYYIDFLQLSKHVHLPGNKHALSLPLVQDLLRTDVFNLYLMVELYYHKSFLLSIVFPYFFLFLR